MLTHGNVCCGIGNILSSVIKMNSNGFLETHDKSTKL